jgi:hypothetical protein
VSLTRPEHPLRVGIVAAVVLVVVNIAYFAGRNQVDGPPAANLRPTAIVVLSPNEGELQPPQEQVGAVLSSDFAAQLTIDNHVIPLDQMTGDAGIGQFYFQPGVGKEFTQLPKGAANAVIEWWPKTIPSIEQAKAQHRLSSYSWSFKVG